MDKLKCPICYTEVGERNFKEAYVSPYNNQQHRCYECLNCEVLEYQNKPREFLEMVKGLLGEGGYVAGSVPNRERLFVEMDWKYFHGEKMSTFGVHRLDWLVVSKRFPENAKY
jgi:2-polyprenyl-3-methyl-5-hydroxy-6-metoxy-1,4-benzoquinol methylase